MSCALSLDLVLFCSHSFVLLPLFHLACIFMWMDVSHANYTTRWDHVFHLIPRACIISKVHLQICIDGCKFAPTPKVMALHPPLSLKFSTSRKLKFQLISNHDINDNIKLISSVCLHSVRKVKIECQ